MPRKIVPPLARTVRSVNDNIRLASSNLAFIINSCGLTQSELARRSGLSRQLINAWARQRVAVSLSTSVGQLLNCLDLSLGDLLLDEPILRSMLSAAHTSPELASHDLTPRDLTAMAAPPLDAARILPHLIARQSCTTVTDRLNQMLGTFRCCVGRAERSDVALERTARVERPDGHGVVMTLFDGPARGEPLAVGACFHDHSTFYVFAESSAEPHRPFIYLFQDPATPEVNTLVGLSITPGASGALPGGSVPLPICLRRVHLDGAAEAPSPARTVSREAARRGEVLPVG